MLMRHHSMSANAKDTPPQQSSHQSAMAMAQAAAAHAASQQLGKDQG